jgi:hypothetical protein
VTAPDISRELRTIAEKLVAKDLSSAVPILAGLLGGVLVTAKTGSLPAGAIAAGTIQGFATRLADSTTKTIREPLHSPRKRTGFDSMFPGAVRTRSRWTL